MRPCRSLALLVGVGLLALASSAHAQATRTWVSGVGDDVNPCSRTAPCKTWAGAISKTAPGGEIDAVDPGGFGAVTITKAVTLDGHVGLSGIVTGAQNAIIVSAGANDVVVIRGLEVNGLGVGLNGIKFNSGKALVVENTSIRQFTQAGIDFEPVLAAQLVVKNVHFTSDAGGGIVVGGTPVSGASSVAVIARSHFFNCGIGLRVTGNAHATATESVFFGNATAGVQSDTSGDLSVERGMVSGNGVGALGDSTLRLSNVMLGHNTTGVMGAKVLSFGNNRLAAGNTSDGVPSGTLPQQ